MTDLIREAPLGQLIRLITRNKVLQYPEEKPDFELPSTYRDVIEGKNSSPGSRSGSLATPPETEKEIEKQLSLPDRNATTDLEAATLTRTKSRTATAPFSDERFEVENELALERTKTTPIAPQKTSDGNILVDWYTTDDPANPHNWSNGKRGFVAMIICMYTFAVYTGSAIYTSGEEGVMERFGPLIFAPMSEIPVIGRSPVYATTFAIFVIISFPTAVVNNFAGLLVLRFLQGFFGSPCLANGGATMQDMYSLLKLPYALTVWVAAAYCGPALGPLLSGFAVTAKGWRWSLWEIVWIAGPVFILMFLTMPETSTPNIHLRRAAPNSPAIRVSGRKVRSTKRTSSQAR